MLTPLQNALPACVSADQSGLVFLLCRSGFSAQALAVATLLSPPGTELSLWDLEDKAVAYRGCTSGKPGLGVALGALVP